jgi:hypothetical protein
MGDVEPRAVSDYTLPVPSIGSERVLSIAMPVRLLGVGAEPALDRSALANGGDFRRRSRPG